MRFRLSDKFIIDSDAEPWKREGLRIGVFGGPGSGKSWNNSLIAEQFLNQGGTVIIFQPRDEYYTLKEKFDIVSVGGVHAKDVEFALTSPKMYAKAVVEDGLSMIFYTSGQDEQKLVDWVSHFVQHVLTFQETHKRPLLLILEEAQEYVPKSASGHVVPHWIYNRMIKAFRDCFTQGRKLNVIAVASSQRPQELNFTVRQLANLSFYGKFSDQDIGYVDKECLKYVRQRGIEVDASRLVELNLGEWLVIAGKQTQYVTVTEPRLTKHGAETPSLEYIAPRTTEAKKTISDLSKVIAEAIEEEEAEKSELQKANRRIKDLEERLELAEEKARIKLSLKEMLEGGAGTEDLVEKLAITERHLKEAQENAKKSNEHVETLQEKLEVAENNLKVFDELKTVLAKIVTPPEQMPGIIHSDSIPFIHHKTERPIITTNESTVEGRIISLALKDFFDSKKRLSQISREVTRVFGVSINLGDLNRALTEVVQMKVLEREREKGRRGWVYSLVDGAKERIKGVK